MNKSIISLIALFIFVLNGINAQVSVSSTVYCPDDPHSIISILIAEAGIGLDSPIELPMDIYWDNRTTNEYGYDEINLSNQASNGDYLKELFFTSAGEYIITIFFNENCETDENITIKKISSIELSSEVTDARNLMCSTGAINLGIEGGRSPFKVEWAGPNGYNHAVSNVSGTDGQEDIDNLEPGLYSVFVKDVCGSSQLIDIEVECCYIELSGFITDATKNHDCDDGAINLYIHLGQAPYTVTWGKLGGIGVAIIQTNTNIQGNDDGEDLANISSGSYVVIVEDAIGCIQFQQFFVECQCDEYCTIVGEILNENCTNTNSISTRLDCRAKGTPPYAYNWSNGATTPDLSNINNGEYCLTVTDGDGCTFDNCWTITSSGGQSLELHVLQVTNNSECLIRDNDYELIDADCDGSIGINISGGVPPYIFNWSNQNGYTSNQQNPTELCPGQYSVEVTDSEGCVVLSEDINICCCENELEIEVGIDDYNPLFCYPSQSPQDFNLTLDPHSLTSAANQDGYIDVDIISSTETFGDNYHYYWTGPNGYISYDEDISNLEVGEYCFHITDGCISKKRCVTLYDCSTLNITIQLTELESSCVSNNGEDYNTGTLAINVSGGITPYTYLWSNGSTSPSLNNIGSGEYCITVTDASTCISVNSIECYQVESADVVETRENCTFTYECKGEIIHTRDLGTIESSFSQEHPDDCRYTGVYCFEDGLYLYDYLTEPIREEFIDPDNCSVIYYCANGITPYEIIYGATSYQYTDGYDPTSNCYFCFEIKICTVEQMDHIVSSYNYAAIATVTNGCDNPSDVYYRIYCDPDDEPIYETDCGEPEPNLCASSKIVTKTTDDKGNIIETITYDNDLLESDKIYDLLLNEGKIGSKYNISIEKEVNKEEIVIIPNPFSVNIEIYYSSINEKEVYAEVINLNGGIVFSTVKELYRGTAKIDLDLSFLMPGLYYIRLTDAKSTTTIKTIIKQ